MTFLIFVLQKSLSSQVSLFLAAVNLNYCLPSCHLTAGLKAH